VLITSKLSEAAISVGLEKLVGWAAKRVGERLRAAADKRELAGICSTALEAAARKAPGLREDLSSQTFVESVVVPTVLNLLANPLNLPDSAGLAADFVSMFVERFARDGDVDATLSRIFQTDRVELESAFEAFFAVLKSSLASSKRWGDVIHRQTTEATFQQTTELLRLYREGIPPPAPLLDRATALDEARRASADLLEWPRDIFGKQIERPEFAQLERRIADTPSGTTLLIGEAGSGKSALLSALAEKLAGERRAVLAIKADRLPADVATLDDIARALDMKEPIDVTVRRLAADEPVVLLIDQLDAVSDVMDRQSARMRLLLRLVASFRAPGRSTFEIPVHVIVSSRPFEADHDARFHQLHAEPMRLTLPNAERIESLLRQLDIDPSRVPDALKDTIRRPFALKLLVDLIRRGVAIDDLLPGEILSRWLNTADLGDPAMRTRVVQLLTDLANEMVETETLWRPLDRFAMMAGDALGRAEATGLVIRNDRGQISFSHQSWLDDFQARGFTTGRSLAEYAWEGQDSLFPRASILRGLQRLRIVDETAYLAAIDLLLGEGRTRRHLKYLVVDLIGTMEPLIARETAWVERLLREDHGLSRRILPRVIRAWPIWRAFALPWLPLLMADDDFRGLAAGALGAEAKIDPDSVMNLIDAHWASPDRDDEILRAIELSGRWTERMRARVTEIMGRATLANYFVSHVMQERMKDGENDKALDFVALFFETGELAERLGTSIYQLETLADAVPEAFAERLFPLFVRLAASGLNPNYSRRDQFDASSALGWDWNLRDGDRGFFQALRRALKLTAEQSPDRLLHLLTPFYAVEIAEVQEVIADALAAGGTHLAGEGLSFLTSDSRRLDIGEADANGADGVGFALYGWSSQQLVRAIVPGLNANQLSALRDLIEGWSRYSADAMAEVSKKDWRYYYRRNEEARLPLLEALPKDVVDARRRRQIAEWRRTQPVIKSVNRLGMAQMIGSPMSNQAMERATDDQIMGMLDAVHDRSDDWRRHGGRLTGGVTQLAQAFGGFAAACPARALNMIETRFVAERHTQAAGSALMELARADGADPERVRALIHDLVRRGFGDENWHNYAAWAFSSLAGRLHGLNTDDLALIDRWIVRDPNIIAEQTARRIENEAKNAEQNARHRQKPVLPSPMLFGLSGGSIILPQRNYSLLAAIADGLLERPEPDLDSWVAVLERHVDDPEDPEIWATLLRHYANPLWWVERGRAQGFFDALIARHPMIFAPARMVGTLWNMRSLFSSQTQEAIVGTWLGGDDLQQQAAGEYLGGVMIVDHPKGVFASLSQDVLEGPSPARLGYIFSAAAAWREQTAQLRGPAHAILMSAGAFADANEAIALTYALSLRREPLLPDTYTRELLALVAGRRDLLAAANGRSLIDGLQGLLLQPGFDADILAVVEGLAALTHERGQRGLGDGDLVQIAIALQRNDGPERAKAMDVYEQLLDAEAYGAAEAAEAALVRNG